MVPDWPPTALSPGMQGIADLSMDSPGRGVAAEAVVEYFPRKSTSPIEQKLRKLDVRLERRGDGMQVQERCWLCSMILRCLVGRLGVSHGSGPGGWHMRRRWHASLECKCSSWPSAGRTVGPHPVRSQAALFPPGAGEGMWAGQVSRMWGVPRVVSIGGSGRRVSDLLQQRGERHGSLRVMFEGGCGLSATSCSVGARTAHAPATSLLSPCTMT